MISGFKVQSTNFMPKMQSKESTNPMYNKPSKVESVSGRISKGSREKNDDCLLDSLFNENPIYERTMSTLKQFSDYKLKMAIRQVEIEKKLSKALDNKIHQNLKSLASNEKNLKKHQLLLQDKLDKATHDLLVSEKFSTIGEYTSRFSHDVRNPLSLIQTQLDILQLNLLKDNDEHSKIAFLRIFSALSGINNMIEQVLNYVRAKPLQIKQFELLDLLKSSLIGCAIPKTIKITLPKESCIILCDDYQIGIVFSNLISNAIESINGYGEIKIKIIDNSDYIIIEIQDSGPGIPKDMIGSIFEPLVTTKKKGTGLGLASCMRIVLQHQGIISAQNNPTRFSIKLPKTIDILSSDNVLEFTEIKEGNSSK